VTHLGSHYPWPVPPFLYASRCFLFLFPIVERAPLFFFVFFFPQGDGGSGPTFRHIRRFFCRRCQQIVSFFFSFPSTSCLGFVPGWSLFPFSSAFSPFFFPPLFEVLPPKQCFVRLPRFSYLFSLFSSLSPFSHLWRESWPDWSRF